MIECASKRSLHETRKMSTQPDTLGTFLSPSSIAVPSLMVPTARRFSVEEYHRMIQSGILAENDLVQLVDGWIIEIPPIGPEHSTSTALVGAAIDSVLPAGWIVRRQDPITLASGEPEPDIVVARGNIRDYSTRHPGPAGIALVVEVADATLKFDRMEKASEYAAAGIPEYWIVNLVDRQIEVHRHPQVATTGPEYRFREVFPSSAKIRLEIESNLIGDFQVAELLP
jgi:Uma2 family endonuclease